MTTYFTAPDGIDEPTLWAETDDPRKPVAILRHRDLGLMAHHWDELVARVIAGNPQPELSDQDAIRRYYQRVRESHPSPTLLAAVDEAEANDERLWALDKAALTQGIERVNNTDNLAAAIADRTENAAAALRDARKELPPRLELTEEESDEFTAALQWDTPSPSYRPGCEHPNVKTTQFCPDCGAFVMVSQR